MVYQIFLLLVLKVGYDLIFRYYNALLLNMTDIITNASAFSLKNAIKVYYKRHHLFLYKIRKFYFKMQNILENVTILLKRCDSYYRMRRCNVYLGLLQFITIIKIVKTFRFSRLWVHALVD